MSHVVVTHGPHCKAALEKIMSMFRIQCNAITMAALALCGCVSRPVPVAAPAAAGGLNTDVQCHLETVTGSLFKERVCLTKAQRDAREGLTDAMKDGLDRQRSIACPNGSAPPCKAF
jgi:hypothetical protein